MTLKLRKLMGARIFEFLKFINISLYSVNPVLLVFCGLCPDFVMHLRVLGLYLLHY